MKSIIIILIVSVILSHICYAGINDPVKFGNSTATTAWIGGTYGILNITGSAIIDENLTTNAMTFSFIDGNEITQPSTPEANKLRLYVEDSNGFSVLKYIDDTGMKRELARDNTFTVKNICGINISANKFVYASGNLNNVTTIALAKADNRSTMPAIGITIENISNGTTGRVMQVGLLENVYINGFNTNDIVYVSDTVAGSARTTPPITPNLTQEMGTVILKNGTYGNVQVITRDLVGDEFGTINNFIVQGNLSSLGTHNAFTGDIDLLGDLWVGESNEYIVSNRFRLFNDVGSKTLASLVQEADYFGLYLQSYSYNYPAMQVLKVSNTDEPAFSVYSDYNATDTTEGFFGVDLRGKGSTAPAYRVRQDGPGPGIKIDCNNASSECLKISALETAINITAGESYFGGNISIINSTPTASLKIADAIIVVNSTGIHIYKP